MRALHLRNCLALWYWFCRHYRCCLFVAFRGCFYQPSKVSEKWCGQDGFIFVCVDVSYIYLSKLFHRYTSYLHLVYFICLLFILFLLYDGMQTTITLISIQWLHNNYTFKSFRELRMNKYIPFVCTLCINTVQNRHYGTLNHLYFI